jgi:hypothetical protein
MKVVFFTSALKLYAQKNKETAEKNPRRVIFQIDNQLN